MNKILKITLQVILLAGIVVVSILITKGVRKPIDFEKDRTLRFGITVDRLKDIRTAQLLYKNVKGCYTNDFDSLINFIATDSIRIVCAKGFVPDSLTEAEAIKLKIVSRDTSYTPIKDSLFRHLSNLNVLRFLPTGKKNMEFKMDTATIMTGSGVEVKVFQCYALNFDILDGLDRQLIVNYNAARKDSCLRVGSITEANNNAGNWE